MFDVNERNMESMSSLALFEPGSSLPLIERLLQGDKRATARLLSLAESGGESSWPVLDAVYARAGAAHVVGVTGVPGSGKSTLISGLTRELRSRNRRIAVLAIDPSSCYSGGAVLGDRIRMDDLSCDPSVFVRSMATRGEHGGLARGALECVDVLDAAGYDPVLVETVGVGQDEVDVASAAHTTVVVSAPGLGDEIQAMKAGFLEIADIHVVTKCDKPEAQETISQLRANLSSSRGINANVWQTPVVGVSAVTGDGISDLVDLIDHHRRALEEAGLMPDRCAQIAERRLQKAGEQIARDRLNGGQDGRVLKAVASIRDRRLSPHAAALQLLEASQIGSHT